MVVWAIGYRGGGGSTLWISMVRKKLRARVSKTHNMAIVKLKLRPISVTLRQLQAWGGGRDDAWGDDAQLRIE